MTNQSDTRFENVARTLWAVAAAITLSMAPAAASAADTAAISRDAQAALNALYAKVPAAKTIGAKAQAVLVFPKITKAGLGIGGQYGDGALIKGGKTVAYYNTTGVSSGLQAGAQSKALVFLFTSPEALRRFQDSKGWSVGADASVALLKIGANGEIDINSARAPVVAFALTNMGLMANLTVEGTKITRIS